MSTRFICRTVTRHLLLIVSFLFVGASVRARGAGVIREVFTRITNMWDTGSGNMTMFPISTINSSQSKRQDNLNISNSNLKLSKHTIALNIWVMVVVALGILMSTKIQIFGLKNFDLDFVLYNI